MRQGQGLRSRFECTWPGRESVTYSQPMRCNKFEQVVFSSYKQVDQLLLNYSHYCNPMNVP
jgi:hypothetical protein